MNSSILRDPCGRVMRKLRVSLLDRCNFRCSYCMPAKPRFLPPSRWLAPTEIIALCREFRSLGIEELRLTGGEPTLRPDFRSIAEGLAEMSWRKMGLTTNASNLIQHLGFLSQIGCQYINISLDSLRPDRFAKLTGRFGLNRVLRAISACQDFGLKPKINVVVMGGVNSDEVFDFVDFSAQTGLVVRFLELMQIGVARMQTARLVPADQLITQIASRYQISRVFGKVDDTAFYYATDHGAKIGFIASETMPFCNYCTRLRLSSDGFLRSCLMSESSLSVRGLSGQALQDTLRQVLIRKPALRGAALDRAMYQIGG